MNITTDRQLKRMATGSTVATRTATPYASITGVAVGASGASVDINPHPTGLMFAWEFANQSAYRWGEDGSGTPVSLDFLSILPGSPLTVAGGGSDGQYGWVVSTVYNGFTFDVCLEQMSRDFSTHIARFSTPWTTDDHDIDDRHKHVAVGKSKVALVANESSMGPTEDLDILIFDTAGSLIDAWSLPGVGALNGSPTSAGHYLSRNEQYTFIIVDHGMTSTETVIKVDITDGTYVDLGFTYDQVVTAIQITDPSFPDLVGLISAAPVGNDLILVGLNRGIVRVHQDGTPVWWVDRYSAGGSYYGAALTSDGHHVWATASLYPDDEADLFTVSGTYLQTFSLAGTGAPNSPYFCWGELV